MFGLGTPELIIITVILFGAAGVCAAARLFGRTRKELRQLTEEIQAPLQVFVSSVMDPKREDLFAERAAAKRAIESFPSLTRAWRFEDSPGSPQSAGWVYLKKVEECDIFVLVLGKEMTRPVMREYWRARKKGKPRLVYLKKCERRPAAQAFVELIRKEVKYAEFNLPTDLDVEIWRSVATLLIEDVRRFKLIDKDVAALALFLNQLPKRGEFETRIETSESEQPSPEQETSAARVKIGRDGKRMIPIPAGWFVMGTSEADILEMEIKFGWKRGWFESETPQHPVYLDAYYIGETPVTNAEYKRFLDAHLGHHVPYDWDKTWRTFPSGKADHPVVDVSWDDANAYARWVGGRLPTEAQWEKAARGTDARRYPWGNQEPDTSHCNFDMKVDDTTPVGKYSPRGDSPYGVMDMAGNVWEWCADWYEGDYYRHSPAHNPMGPSSTLARVVRGGAWNNPDRALRCAFRSIGFPLHLYGNRGFRVALSPVASGL